MSSLRRLAAALGLSAATVVACSNNSGDAGSSGATPAPDGGGGEAGDSSRPAAVPCSEPVDQRPANSACVKTVSGALVEDTSAATPLKLLTTVCGTGLCLYAQGDASGFTVAVNRFVDLNAFVLHVDGRPTHANVYVRLAPAASDALTLPLLRIPPLDRVGPALPETPPGAALTVRAGDVALTLAPTAVVELDFADAALEAEGRKLRSGRVSAQVLTDPKLVALHALSPFGATVTPAADVAVTLPGGMAMPDGTVLDMVALEDTLDVPETGKLKVIGTATVTTNVAKSDPGTSLGRLTWVGLRKKGN